MDIKDRKILYELDKNARESFTQLGKATHIAPESARYRINNYIKEDIIKYFLTVIDSAKLGASYYDIFLKLQNVDLKKKKEIISFLVNSPNITWVADIEGMFDIAFIVMVQNQLELQKLMEQINQQFSSSIMKKTIAINLKGEFLRRDYLINKKREESISTKTKKIQLEYSPSTSIITLEDLDKQICRLLSNNSRMNSVELGKKLNVSPDTIMLHIKKLQEQKIISGYTIILNNEKINQLHYKLLLYINNTSQDKTNKLIAYIKMNNRVIAVIKTLAEWDYEIDIEVDSVNQLKEFTMELTNNFSEIIKDYNTIRIVDMPKYNFFP
ncbi:MAG: Lrp/AsnC family transcriptional regulator [Candidatus Woesearchaeota archaeon]